MKFEGVIIPSPRKPSKLFIVDKDKLIEFSKKAKSNQGVEFENLPAEHYDRFLCPNCIREFNVSYIESVSEYRECDNCKKGAICYGVKDK
jgi:ribosomal protein S27AE